MRQAEPSSNLRSSLFMIGQDSRGNWVVRDQRGLCGGIFIDRAKALRFAMFENGNRPRAYFGVKSVTTVLKTVFSCPPMRPTVVTMATLMPRAMRPYSIAVAPD